MKQDENKQPKDQAQDQKAEPKPAPRAGASRRKKRAPKAYSSTRTVMKLTKSVRAGGSSTIQYTKEAITRFNTFTQSPQSGRLSKLRGVNMTFPLFIVLSFLVLVLALMALDNSSVSVDRRTISLVGLPEDLEGYTILQVSDLHARDFGADQTALLRAINGEAYNLIVFTGDMVGASGNAQPFYDLLEGLTANRPRYFIPGDSDPDILLKAPRDITGTLEEVTLNDWVLGAKERGASLLSSATAIEVGKAKLWLTPASQLNLNITESLKLLDEQMIQETEGSLSGLEGDYNNLPFTTWRYNQLKGTQDVIGLMSAEDVQIALSHIPPSEQYITVSQELSAEGTRAYLYTPDLVLAGHYCGGGWKLPFIGAFYIPSTFYARHGWFPAREDVEGIKQLGGTLVYTSPGLGMTDRIYLPKFRLLNSPKITTLTLTSAISDMLGS
jgi:predicted MPP superfamily phosphohydrolase